jgi:transcriptional regulator with XRE-family HTH domain
VLVDTLVVSAYNQAMRLGVALRERRRELGLTTTQVAEMVGVRQSAVSKWENGASLPDDDRLDAIAQFLGVSRADVVLMRDGTPSAPTLGAGRADAIEARLDRVELQLGQMIELLRDLDRRIQGTSQGDGGGA